MIKKNLPVHMYPSYIDSPSGGLFTLLFLPDGASVSPAVTLLVPPFAEEMNKSRHMLSMQARHLAAAGLPVCMLDLSGTGDSYGDFGAATWEIWLSDLECCIAWLVAQGYTSINLLALRSGALLAGSYLANTNQDIGKLVLWQPVVRGDAFIKQFFRIKIAESMSASTGGKLSTADLRDTLEHSGFIEIAGYCLNSTMVEQLEGCMLSAGALGPVRAVYWFELATAADKPMLPASRNLVDAINAHGVQVSTQVVTGPTFWQSSEICECPELIEKTTEALL